VVGVTSASSVSVAASEESLGVDSESAVGSVDVAVESYALEYGVSLVEAARRLERIETIKEVLASVRGVEVKRLAGWGIDHRDSFTGWVLLTGDDAASAEAVALVAAHSDVEIRTGAKHSYADLQAAQRALSAQLFAARNATSGGALGSTGEVGQSVYGAQGVVGGNGVGAGVAEVVTFLDTDMAGNAVRVGIDPGLASEVGPLGTVSELSFEQSAAVVEAMLQNHIEVAFKIADGRDISLAANFLGGDTMTVCTSGFTARQISVGSYGQITIGNYGIITAGHCGGDFPTDTEPVTMRGVSLPFVRGWLSPTADAQFHRIPVPKSGSHYVLDDYWCRTINSYPNPTCDVVRTEARSNMQGDFICHNGKNSGTSCGEVISVDSQLNFGKKRPCRNSNGVRTDCGHVFVRVQGNHLRSCDGDSGGPYYKGGIAYGIHAGSIKSTGCDGTVQYTIFSAIREVETFLGVQVLTQPVTLRTP